MESFHLVLITGKWRAGLGIQAIQAQISRDNRACDGQLMRDGGQSAPIVGPSSCRRLPCATCT